MTINFQINGAVVGVFVNKNNDHDIFLIFLYFHFILFFIIYFHSFHVYFHFTSVMSTTILTGKLLEQSYEENHFNKKPQTIIKPFYVSFQLTFTCSK